MWPHDVTKGENIAGGVGGEAPGAIDKGVWGRSFQPPTDFYGFHSFQHTLLSKEDITRGGHSGALKQRRCFFSSGSGSAAVFFLSTAKSGSAAFFEVE